MNKETKNALFHARSENGPLKLDQITILTDQFTVFIAVITIALLCIKTVANSSLPNRS